MISPELGHMHDYRLSSIPAKWRPRSFGSAPAALAASLAAEAAMTAIVRRPSASDTCFASTEDEASGTGRTVAAMRAVIPADGLILDTSVNGENEMRALTAFVSACILKSTR